MTTAWKVAGPLCALLAWAGVVDTGLVRHRALAGPLATTQSVAAGFADGTLGADVAASAWRVAAGVALGLVLGAPLGLWIGTSGLRARLVEPSLDFLRAIPPLLVFPLLLLAFGYDDRARIGAVAWAAVLVVSLHVAARAGRARPERLRALRAMGASRWQLLRWHHAYEALPVTLTALRHAVATGIVVAVVTEMVVGAPHGLGSRAVQAQIAYDTADLYGVIFVTGLLGWAVGRAILGAERRLVTWSG